jgi:hypothetical protein
VLSRRLSFRTWYLFRKLLKPDSSDLGGLSRFYLEIENSKTYDLLPLTEYVAPLVSPSFDFLVTLSITTSFTVAELMRLTALKNIASLTILSFSYRPPAGYESPISDRLVRAWSDAARNEGAFPVLRILKLYESANTLGSHRPTQMTVRCLEFLPSFPQLFVFEAFATQFSRSEVTKFLPDSWSLSEFPDALEHLDALCKARGISIAADQEPDGEGKYADAMYHYRWWTDLTEEEALRQRALALKSQGGRSELTRAHPFSEDNEFLSNACLTRIEQLLCLDHPANALPLHSTPVASLHVGWRSHRDTDIRTAASDRMREVFAPPGKRWSGELFSGKARKYITLVRQELPREALLYGHGLNSASSQSYFASQEKSEKTGRIVDGKEELEGEPAKGRKRDSDRKGVRAGKRRMLGDVLSTFY